jgi:hypothetical protein
MNKETSAKLVPNNFQRMKTNSMFLSNTEMKTRLVLLIL